MAKSILFNLFFDLDRPPEQYRRRSSILHRVLQGGTRKTALKPQSNGFSLVELMVVIFIIGLLSAVVIINVLPSQEKAMVEKARADIATLGQAMEMYRLDNLSYPTASDGLEALQRAPASLSQPGRYRPGGYIKQLPDDPWGHAYQYRVPGQSGAFDIFSLGADGQPGGEGENADIFAGQ